LSSPFLSATLPPAGPSTPDGVLVLDKPPQRTSHDIVARVRRTLGLREVGHAGTLDPMATGVLVVAVGRATKLVPWLTADDKAYEACIAFGVQTDTLDSDGRVVASKDVGNELVRALSGNDPGHAPALLLALSAERARTSQVPPSHSAIRINGRRSYALARRGEPITLASRPVRVERLDVLEATASPSSLTVALEVGKGYYVRALARDIAQALGTVGHLTRLRRTRSGRFTLAEALPFDSSAADLRAAMLPLASAAGRVLPVAHLSEQGERDARHGRAVGMNDFDEPHVGKPFAWLDRTGELVAVGRIDDEGRGRVLRGFA
jgi:tRNA pseudouridine55 synthase